MKILVAFYSKSDNTKSMAQALKDAFESNSHEVKFLELIPKNSGNSKELLKLGKFEFEEEIFDVSEFDLIVIGTPVANFSVHFVVEKYVRLLENTENKKVGLFCSSVALAGSTIKSLDSLLSTMQADVIGSLTIKSLFELDKKKIDKVKKFALELMKKSL